MAQLSLERRNLPLQPMCTRLGELLVFLVESEPVPLGAFPLGVACSSSRTLARRRRRRRGIGGLPPGRYGSLGLAAVEPSSHPLELALHLVELGLEPALDRVHPHLQGTRRRTGGIGSAGRGGGQRCRRRQQQRGRGESGRLHHHLISEALTQL